MFVYEIWFTKETMQCSLPYYNMMKRQAKGSSSSFILNWQNCYLHCALWNQVIVFAWKQFNSMWRRMKAGGTQVNVRHLNKQNSIITMLSLFMMAHRIKLLACLFARWLAYLFCSILQHQLLHFNDNYCCSISWQLLGFLQEWHSKLSGRLLFEIQMLRISMYDIWNDVWI